MSIKANFPQRIINTLLSLDNIQASCLPWRRSGAVGQELKLQACSMKPTCTHPVNLHRRTQLTSASPSPLQECQNTILFLLPSKNKSDLFRSNSGSCTFCMLLWLFGWKVEVLLSPERTCFTGEIIVCKRGKLQRPSFSTQGFAAEG